MTPKVTEMQKMLKLYTKLKNGDDIPNEELIEAYNTLRAGRLPINSLRFRFRIFLRRLFK